MPLPNREYSAASGAHDSQLLEFGVRLAALRTKKRAAPRGRHLSLSQRPSDRDQKKNLAANWMIR